MEGQEKDIAGERTEEGDGERHGRREDRRRRRGERMREVTAEMAAGTERDRAEETARAWIELDRQALARNVQSLRACLPAGCRLMPAVKAEAYGHGAALVAGELTRLGITDFCVATAEEGRQLREAGIAGDMLVLGYTGPSQFPLLWEYGLVQAVVDASYAEELNRCGHRVRVHVAVDTGMHRLGLDYRQTDRLLRVFRMPNLQAEGIFSHLCADDPATVERQARAFAQACRVLEAGGIRGIKRHLLASGGILKYPQLGGDYARPGIALYGVLGTREEEETCPVPLSPVLSLKARVASVREIAAGEGAGYGLRFRAARPTRLAALAIGYADGLPRNLSQGVGEVLIRGRRALVAGNMCMDQTLVDVTDIPGVRAGDVCVLIGRMGEEEIRASEAAEKAGTITNEILSRLGARLPRMFAEADRNPPCRR